MIITNDITREVISQRGGGVELDLTSYGYEGEFLSAYQNYLGGGILGAVANDSTVTDWESDPVLFELARELREVFYNKMHEAGYIEEHNKDLTGRKVSAY